MPAQYTLFISTCTEPPDYAQNVPAEYEAFFALKRWIESGRIHGEVETQYLCRAEVSREELLAFIDGEVGGVIKAYSSPASIEYAQNAVAALLEWIASKPAPTRFLLSGDTL